MCTQNVQLKEMQRSLSKGLVADVIDLHFESIDAKILSDCLAGKWEKVWEKWTKNISLSFLEQSKCSECSEYIYKAITDFN